MSRGMESAAAGAMAVSRAGLPGRAGLAAGNRSYFSG